MKPKHNRGSFSLICGGALLIVVLAMVSCARDRSLVIENTSPPRFVFQGPGVVTHLQVTGPDLERESNPVGDGDRLTALKVYWELASSPGRSVNDIGPVTYGRVPDGFVQIEPRNGASPPQLVEQHLYNIRLSVEGGEGFNNFFVIRNGRIVSEADR